MIKIGKKFAHIGKLVHVRVLYPSCASIPGIFIAGRGGRIRALRLLVLETGRNACTGRARFSFYFHFYFLIINLTLNNNEFTIDNGYAAVETHSKSSIIKLLSKLYELVLLQTVKSYRQALAPPMVGAGQPV